MSLLDDVSIVVTPNGYKAGTLYGVLPTATEGSELILNGDFINGNNWSVTRGNWAISGDTLNTTSESDYCNTTTGNYANKTMRVTFDVVSYTQGSVAFRVFGSSYQVGTSRSGVGTYTEIIVFQAGHNGDVGFQGLSSFTGAIDNVSVKEFTASDMDVTRATAATRVDENGLVNYAEILGSEQVTAFTNGTVYPFTTFTTSGNNITSAIISSAFAGAVSNAISVTSGEIYKVTFDYTKNSGDDLRILFSSVVTGAGTQISNSELISTSGTYTKYFTITSTTTGYFQMGTGNSGHSLNASITNVSVKECTRNNVPRIDYTGGGCPHILAEPQSTNLIAYSEDFSNSYWTKSGASIVSNDAISPNGTLNASKLVEFSTNTAHICFNQQSGASKTFSFFAKSAGNQYVAISYDGGTNFNFFDIVNGVLGNIADSSRTSKIEDYGNGWFRCSLYNGHNNFGATIWMSKDGVNTTYQGDGSSGVYIYGAQLELSTYPTSYIPTSGSTVTRNADQFSRDGIASLINDSEGVLFLEVARLSSADNTSIIWSISDGSNSNAVSLYYATVGVKVDIFNSTGTKSLQHSMSLTEQANFNKLAIKYKSNDIAIWVNGNEVATNTDAISLSGLNELISSYGSGSFPFYGKVKQLQVYKTALTDLQIESITSWTSFAEMANSLNYTIY